MSDSSIAETNTSNRLVSFLRHPATDAAICTILVSGFGAAVGAAANIATGGSPARGAIAGVGIGNGFFAAQAAGEALADKLASKTDLIFTGTEDLKYGMKKRCAVVAFSAVAALTSGGFFFAGLKTPAADQNISATASQTTLPSSAPALK